MLSLSLLPISIFFEYEMDISYINAITGLKNMEDSRDRRFRKEIY